MNDGDDEDDFSSVAADYARQEVEHMLSCACWETSAYQTQGARQETYQSARQETYQSARQETYQRQSARQETSVSFFLKVTGYSCTHAC